jgi:SH3 domain-containing YSC84-like protein 1
MKKLILCLLIGLISTANTFAADDEHEEDRVKDAGAVLKEILNIPDDIPQDLLDKAECLIILPSVKKGAFGIGGSYGRGVMVCRSGEHYKGKWGAPALYALEGVSIGFQLGGQDAEILSYSRNKGLFAGVSLEGSTLRSDGSANEKLYGKKLTAKEIIREGKVSIPPSAHELISLLDTKTPVNRSDPKSLE